MGRSPFSALRAAAAAAGLLLGAACAPWAAPAPSEAPEPAVAAERVGPFVAAANPLAAEAGMAVLRAGGSAVDAAVAIQVVLGLVEPQSSGLGGGAFLLHYDAGTGAVTAWDGRETAPAAATPDLFFEDGEPLGYREAVLSGRSTGAPGAVAVLGAAHAAHGRLPWRGLFDDARRLASDGFTVSPRLAGMINNPNIPQAWTPAASAYFTGPDGRRLQAGDTLRNPAYARTLARLAEGGAGALYEGEIAEAILAAVAEGPRPGALSAADLAAYRPRQVEPVCRPWRLKVVCAAPPPSSGAALLQLLAMADHTPALEGGPADAGAWAAFAGLQRLMYADRDRYFGDPAFVAVPVAGLLDPAYVADRAARVDNLGAPVGPGRPPGAPARAPDATVEPAGTSHFVVVDGRGDAVSMTTTVESVFGSGRMAAGFFLNNQLTDFSFAPTGADGAPAANAVAPGKRPRSSMAPVILLEPDGRLAGALGSPGGNSILAYNAKALIGVLVWDLSMQQAIDLPNLVARGDRIGADTALFAPALREALAARGVALRPNSSETSGLHGVIWREGRGWDGGADPRREGVALYD